MHGESTGGSTGGSNKLISFFSELIPQPWDQRQAMLDMQFSGLSWQFGDITGADSDRTWLV